MCIACMAGGREPKVFDCLEAETVEAVAAPVSDDPASGVPSTMRYDEGTGDVAETIAGAQAITISELVTGTISNADDEDMYAVQLIAGREYIIDLDPRAGSGSALTDTFLSLFDASGSLVASNDDADYGALDFSSRISFVPTVDGTYYVLADAYSTDTGEYQMTIADNGVAPPASPTDAIDWQTYTAPSSINVFVVGAGQTVTTNYGDTFATSGWNADELDALTRALAEYERVIDVDFTIVSDPSQADFMFLETDLVEPGRLGYWSIGGGTISVEGVNYTLDGYGVFNSNGFGWDAGGLQAGGLGYETLVHELGHGMGLAHPHDSGGGSDIMRGVTNEFRSYGQFDLNQGIYTVMSYNRGWETNPDGTPNSDDWGGLDGLGTFDIAVLQRKYGAAVTATGNDIYTLPSANGAGTYYRTIWDTAGADAISAAGMLGDATIDLRAADTSSYAPNAGGYVSYVAGVFGGFLIAEGVVIETATGGEGNDAITGNDADNFLYGNGGSDAVSAGAGNDVVRGGEGSDSIEGGAGSDRLFGEGGDDTVNGGDGSDTIIGGSGVDTIDGGAGTDTIRGGTGDDTINGGTERDKIYGDGGNDTLNGEDGDDLVRGFDDDDTVLGGAGNDYLTGDGGNDELRGGIGNDILLGGLGIDILFGGDGLDVLNGGDGDDTLDGGAEYDRLFGLDGNDTLDGGDGDDRVRGNDGDDTVRGGAGSDIVTGDLGNDMVYGGIGNDTLLGGGGGDMLFGEADNDTLVGNGGADTLDGGEGDDNLAGGDGNDTLHGGAGADTVNGNRGDDTVYGGMGDDTVTGAGGNDALFGDAGNDTLDAGNGFDLLVGGAGVDVLTGGGSADIFAFADGDFGASADTITDFAPGLDTLDLGAIDANAGVADDQAFVFIGAAAFSATAGELRFENEQVLGDTDGDGIADFRINLTNVSSLNEADLVL